MKSFIIFSLFFIVVSISSYAQCGFIIYVDANAPGLVVNGSTWNNAYLDLQTALDRAEACSDVQEIWVAEGTYRPTIDISGGTSTGTQNLVFNIDFDVKIYGGFCGWESEKIERVKYLCPSILSGDHSSNDSLITDKTNIDFPFSNGSDNSYNIMRMKNLTTDAMIDGFSFVGGNAVHPSTLSKRIGGAIFNDGRGTNSISNPQIVNCTFEYNRAQLGGGAIYNYGVNSEASMKISTSEFNYNRSQDHGGALMNHGEGITAASASSGAITSCLFRDNVADNEGAGIYCLSAASGQAIPLVQHCTFVYNQSRVGAGLYAQGPVSGSMPVVPITGSIFFFNYATADIARSSFDVDGADISITYSLFPGAIVDQIDFNLNTNPDFVNNNNNFRLKPTSPVRDKGEAPPSFSILLADKDLDDNARSLGGIKDMGAYEFLACPQGKIIYVDSDSGNFRTGTSASTALSSLNMALNMACNCDELPTLNIAHGRYVPHRLSGLLRADDRKTHSFSIDCPLVIKGTVYTSLTGDILNNDTGNSDTDPSRDDNCDHVIYTQLADSIVIEDVMISSANDGGLRIDGRSINKKVTVTNCYFINNAEAALSLGLGSNDHIIKIEKCNFHENYKDGSFLGEGCINIVNSGKTTIDILESSFDNNEIGGVYLRLADSSQSFINRCRFTKNTSLQGGGLEFDIFNGEVVYHKVSNCEFIDNTALSSGAAISARRAEGVNIDISNCTIFRSTTNAANRGAVEFIGSGGDATVKDCIFWDNSSTNGIIDIAGNVDLSYSLIESDQCPAFGAGIVNCIEMMQYNVDPQFMSLGGTFGADLRLKSTSPAINRGSSTIHDNPNYVGPQDLDLYNNNRIRTNRVDLGAAEFQPVQSTDCPPTVVNPVDAPATELNVSIIAQTSIDLSQEYITPTMGGLFLDARTVNIYPSLEIEIGAVMEIHVGGCN